MSPYEALRAEVDHFVAGGSLLRLREWVEAHDEPASRSADERLRNLISDVWTRISECDLGELSEADARCALSVVERGAEML